MFRKKLKLNKLEEILERVHCAPCFPFRNLCFLMYFASFFSNLFTTYDACTNRVMHYHHHHRDTPHTWYSSNHFSWPFMNAKPTKSKGDLKFFGSLNSFNNSRPNYLNLRALCKCFYTFIEKRLNRS